MTTKTISIIITISLLAIGVVAFAVTNQKDQDTPSTFSEPTNTISATQPQEETSTASPDASFTPEEVAQHNSRSDCWTIINGVVYNLTAYIPRHSGGDNILSACGVDGTSYFNGEQSGQLGRSNDHSSSRSALQQLESLRIGTVAQ